LPLDVLHADFVLAWRRLRNCWIASAAAVLSVALGMGACLGAFELVNALFWRPLPIVGADRLYALFRQDPPVIRDTWQYPLLRAMRDSVADEAALLDISEAESSEIAFRSDPEPERAQVQYVSGTLFAAFGLRAAAGRLLSQQDDLRAGGHPVAVLSHDYWSRRFAQDPRVIGRTFRLTNNLTGTRIYQVVGVVEGGFAGTEPGNGVDLFLPATMHWGIAYPQWSLFRGFVHLRPGASAARVRGRLHASFRSFHRSNGDGSKEVLEMEPASAGVSPLQGQYGTSLAALNVLAALVLLIACANVANLMLAQTAARTREMALRLSLGAGARRLWQPVVAEASILSAAAAAVGWWLARSAVPLVLAKASPPGHPAQLSLTADWRVLAFAFLLTFGAILIFSVAPAFRACRTRPVEALKGRDDPHSRGRWMRSLIALQTAFCCLVVFAAGLFVTTVERLEEQPNGISAQGILNVDVVNPANEPSSLWDQVADRLRELPGVQAVAYADWPVLDGRSFKTDAISIEGQAPAGPAWFLNVSPGWFAALEIPLLSGRDFNGSDLSPGAAVVNEAFAHRFFGDANPLGRWFAGTSGWMSGQKFQIVGVVRNARYRYLRQPFLPVAYTPFRRLTSAGTMQGGTLVVRIAGSPERVASLIRREVPLARPEFRVTGMRTQQELIESQTVRERLLAMLARCFGAVALLLAGLGLYGVLEYGVWQRRREIGIRVAVGARPRQVAIHVTARFLGTLLAGAVAGLGFSLASVRYIEPLLYQVRPSSAAMLLIPTVAVTVGVSIAALPAVIHALRIDVARLLRTE
jgi:predicted permease